MTGGYETGSVDTGPVDIGPVDIGPVDIGPVDIGPVDIGPVEADSVEAGSIEAGSVEDGAHRISSFETGALVTSAWEDPLTGSAPVALSLVDLAQLVGGYRWVEFRMFEVLGSWVTSESQPEARLMFDVQSRQHAWHAQLWADRLPAVAGVIDPDLSTAPPDDGLDELFTTLGGPGGAAAGGGTLLRLVGLARVAFPRISCGYALHLRRALAVSDSAVVRALRLALRDEIEAWQTTELMVQSLIRRPHDVEVVTAHQQRLESLVAGSGPGLVPWPDDQHR